MLRYRRKPFIRQSALSITLLLTDKIFEPSVIILYIGQYPLESQAMNSTIRINILNFMLKNTQMTMPAYAAKQMYDVQTKQQLHNIC